MAGDSVDSSLLTSAIKDDSRKVYVSFPTEDRFPCRESPRNSNDPTPQFDTRPGVDDARTTSRERDPNDSLLSEFTELDDYTDSYESRNVRIWISQFWRRLSKICSKSRVSFFFLNQLYTRTLSTTINLLRRE